NVEEWCYDWYGPYEATPQRDPVGWQNGYCRVTRGGSHNTFVRYLRSANRQGMLPQDKHWLTGFRVVQAAMPGTAPLSVPLPVPLHRQHVSQQTYTWKKVTQPLFEAPVPFVIRPDSLSRTPFYTHNHCPAITWCPNGDLLAAWFSTNSESGREMTILASRLRAGKKAWGTASEFLRVPDRNLTGTSLFYDSAGTLYHLNGMEAAGDWQNLAVVMRTSRNNGATWSKPVIIAPEHSKRHQVIAGLLQTREKWLIQLCDADPSSSGGTAIYVSKDKGAHWYRPDTATTKPVYAAGNTGHFIAGIHGAVVQRKDGSLLALGRN